MCWTTTVAAETIAAMKYSRELRVDGDKAHYCAAARYGMGGTRLAVYTNINMDNVLGGCIAPRRSDDDESPRLLSHLLRSFGAATGTAVRIVLQNGRSFLFCYMF